MNSEKVFPGWIWLIYILLFSFSIPWYLPEKQAMRLTFGLPLWVILSILAVILIALFTSWVINKYWKE